MSGGGMFTTLMSSAIDAGFTLAFWTPGQPAGDGVFSPASALNLTNQRIISSNPRLVVRVEDIYINSDNPHDLNLFYRPSPVPFLPSGPGPVTNDTLIYEYVGRSNVNPFHEDDDSPTLRRLKKLVFGPFGGGNVPNGGAGTLQFQVPPVDGVVKVTIQWSFVSPGGGVGS
jgi:hypothetical protein